MRWRVKSPLLQLSQVRNKFSHPSVEQTRTKIGGISASSLLGREQKCKAKTYDLPGAAAVVVDNTSFAAKSLHSPVSLVERHHFAEMETVLEAPAVYTYIPGSNVDCNRAETGICYEYLALPLTRGMNQHGC